MVRPAPRGTRCVLDPQARQRVRDVGVERSLTGAGTAASGACVRSVISFAALACTRAPSSTDCADEDLASWRRMSASSASASSALPF